MCWRFVGVAAYDGSDVAAGVRLYLDGNPCLVSFSVLICTLIAATSDQIRDDKSYHQMNDP